MSSKIRINMQVNGKDVTFEAYPMARLLDVLREDCELLGTKEGCGEGECGACSVFLNGRLVNSCLVPAAQCAGAEVTTIEGISENESSRVLQEAFLEKGGAQCGICTPGMILAALNILKKSSNPSRDEIRQGLAGNLCRCTGYMKIYEAVETAAARLGGRS